MEFERSTDSRQAKLAELGGEGKALVNENERLHQVKEALAWAYRSGYFLAEVAAEELAQHLGEQLGHRDLGIYGDTLEWRTKGPEIVPAEVAEVSQ